MQQAMIIDLNKRRGGVSKKLEHALMDVGEWNAENPTHPRSPNGRFMSAAGASHEAVADLLHGLVKEHKAENTKLGQSILEHIGRPAEPRTPRVRGTRVQTLRERQADWSESAGLIRAQHDGTKEELLAQISRELGPRPSKENPWPQGRPEGSPGRKLSPRAQYEKDLQAWQAEGSFISNMHHEDDPVRAAKLRAHAERKPVEPAGRARGAVKPPSGDAASIAKELHGIPTESGAGGLERARALLHGKTNAELKDIAAAAGPTVSAKGTKAQLIDNIIEGTLGYRQRSHAIGGWGDTHEPGRESLAFAPEGGTFLDKPKRTKGKLTPERFEGAYGTTATQALFGKEPLPGSHAWNAMSPEEQQASMARRMGLSPSKTESLLSEAPKAKRAGKRSAEEVSSVTEKLRQGGMDRDQIEQMLEGFTGAQLKEIVDSGAVGPVMPGGTVEERAQRIAQAATFGAIFDPNSALNTSTYSGSHSGTFTGNAETSETKRDSSLPNPSKPLRSKVTSSRGEERLSAVKRDIAAMQKRPEYGDREKVRGSLQGLTVAEIDDTMQHFGMGKSIGKTRAEKIDNATESLIGFKLTHDAILGVGAFQESGDRERAKRAEQVNRLFGFKPEYSDSKGPISARSEERLNAVKRDIAAMTTRPKAGDRERVIGSLEGLTAPEVDSVLEHFGLQKAQGKTKAEKISSATEALIGLRLTHDSALGVERSREGGSHERAAAFGVENIDHMFEGSGARDRRLAREARAAAAQPERKMSPNLRKRNTWGGLSQEEDVHYHPSGEIGYAADHLGEDTQLEIDGDSLVNQLDRIATDTVRGRTNEAQQVARLKALEAKLPEGPGKRAVQGAIRNLDVPAKAAPVTLPEGTPGPIRKLVDELASIPMLSKTEEEHGGTAGEQAPRLWQAVQAFADEYVARVAAGRSTKLMPDGSAGQKLFSNIPHESLEGSAHVRDAINRAMKELRD